MASAGTGGPSTEQRQAAQALGVVRGPWALTWPSCGGAKPGGCRQCVVGMRERSVRTPTTSGGNSFVEELRNTVRPSKFVLILKICIDPVAAWPISSTSLARTACQAPLPCPFREYLFLLLLLHWGGLLAIWSCSWGQHMGNMASTPAIFTWCHGPELPGSDQQGCAPR
jgi:hypothetical protein